MTHREPWRVSTKNGLDSPMTLRAIVFRCDTRRFPTIKDWEKYRTSPGFVLDSNAYYDKALATRATGNDLKWIDTIRGAMGQNYPVLRDGKKA